MNVIRTYGFVGVLVVAGAYLTMPVALFDIGDDVLVLDSENIRRVMAAAEELSELPPNPKPDDLAALQAFSDACDRIAEIQSRGHPGHRLRLQTLTARYYQQPCFIRSIFGWHDQAGDVFGSADEYLLWLWFTIFCVSVAYVVQLKIGRRWKHNGVAVGIARWSFFCGCVMAVSMILAALLESHVRLVTVALASRVLSGPVYLIGGYRMGPGGGKWEEVIGLSAVQWVTIGVLGSILLWRLKGRGLAWLVAGTLAACALTGLAVLLKD